MITSSKALNVRRAGVSDRCPQTRQRRSSAEPARRSEKNVRMTGLLKEIPSVRARRSSVTRSPSRRQTRRSSKRGWGLLDNAESAVVTSHVPQASIVVDDHLADPDVLRWQRED